MNLELGYGISTDTSNIVLNLMPVILNSKQKENNASNISPIIITPLFRLLQICEQSQISISLNALQELLGCPVSLPHQNELKEFSKLSIEMKHAVCDATFFCLNWFRELVNAFAATSNNHLRSKVIKRLKDIINLQNILQNLLCETPGYIPVQANFDLDINELSHKNFSSVNIKKKKTVPKKKGKGKKHEVQETKSQNLQTQDIEDLDENTEDKSKDNTNNLSAYSIFFRELDLDIFILLQNGLDINSDLELHSEENLKLNPSVLCFLIEDLNHKLTQVLQHSSLPSIFKGTNEKKSSFSNLNIRTPTEIVEQVIALLPALCDLFEITCDYFKAIIEKNDGIIDGLEMFTDVSIIIAHCSELILQTIHMLLSWNSFLGKNKTLLQEILKVFASRNTEISVSSLGLQDTAKYAFQYLEKFSSNLSTLESSTMLIKVLDTIVIHLDDDTKNTLAHKAETFLRQEWDTKKRQKSKKAKINDHIRTLLKTYLKFTSDTMKELEILSTKAIPQLVESESKEVHCTDFPTLNKSTFNVYYQMMYYYLCEDVKDYFSKNKNSKENQESNLKQWLIAVRIFHVLVNLLKVFDGKLNIACTLKYGRQFVDMFLKQGMPLLDEVFRSHCAEVQNLLKTLQMSNRFLQHVCSHSKVTKDVVLTKQVPTMKRTLESFVYRVKAMLALNKCKDAFWLGNLKNRDLQGVEILSQTTQNDSDEDISQIMTDDESDVELEERPPSDTEYSVSF
ncbi:Fanconi anemia group D2 protein-like isoform X1 [Centruroides sculpturatus]|uniref:Fanconi anemia group D2 protein-like isoform X1 n=1 Tax=Centruroides sculpturatus TaxID=218467 RepID=UPI000C6CBD8B|nr:Fanconi anemia group D2 protein-like isoform X1 [Centruroides sculpturatus]XP_023244638.1 Fanconi anemia group D2 protein-like isoform X1 [Centruroides sculpturatus]